MGRVFLEHMGGEDLFLCGTCFVPLTNRDELISSSFAGVTGRAYLFKKAVNLIYGKKHSCQMLTGLHLIRDVSCKQCHAKMGWMYEFAYEESQRYKEGRIVLELSMIAECAAFGGDE